MLFGLSLLILLITGVTDSHMWKIEGLICVSILSRRSFRDGTRQGINQGKAAAAESKLILQRTVASYLSGHLLTICNFNCK